MARKKKKKGSKSSNGAKKKDDVRTNSPQVNLSHDRIVSGGHENSENRDDLVKRKQNDKKNPFSEQKTRDDTRQGSKDVGDLRKDNSSAVKGSNDNKWATVAKKGAKKRVDQTQKSKMSSRFDGPGGNRSFQSRQDRNMKTPPRARGTVSERWNGGRNSGRFAGPKRSPDRYRADPKPLRYKYSDFEARDASPSQRKKGVNLNNDRRQYARHHRYAYTTLVMNGDSYVTGAITMAHSLRLTGTPHEVVCMVTPDVSNLSRERLSVVFHRVIEVPYLEAPCKKLRTSKQREKYESWINVSFTKWHCLNFMEYDKVIFVDADFIFLSGCDTIFDLQAPGATFSTPWVAPFIDETRRLEGKPIDRKGDFRRSMFNPYKRLDKGGNVLKQPSHGVVITPDMVMKGLHGKDGQSSYVCIGTMVLLRPSSFMFDKFLGLLNNARTEPYGNPQCNNGFDEQIIAELFAREGISFSMIHQSFNYIMWHRGWLDFSVDVPRVLHYFGKKPQLPWDMKCGQFPDLEYFWQFARNLFFSLPRRKQDLLFPIFKEDNLMAPNSKCCNYCKELGFDYDHSTFDSDMRLRCVNLRNCERAGVKGVPHDENGVKPFVKARDLQPSTNISSRSTERPQRLKFFNSKKTHD